jgi:UDP-N-acetylmuramate--alanine ligase
VHRRFELKGTVGGVRVYDDYAHHPTEVEAQLRAARAVAGSGRVVVAFQPHLYSRTREFAAAFGPALGLADEVVVMDVYGAREDPVPAYRRDGRRRGRPAGRAGALRAVLVGRGPGAGRPGPPGDLVITMGAGNVSMVGPEVLEALRARLAPPGSPAGGDPGGPPR